MIHDVTLLLLWFIQRKKTEALTARDMIPLLPATNAVVLETLTAETDCSDYSDCGLWLQKSSHQ